MIEKVDITAKDLFRPIREAERQDAGRSRTLNAGAESPPFSSRDLYGTSGDRLLNIAIVMEDLSKRFLHAGDTRLSGECFATSQHYATLARLHRRVEA
jgi:hypothetical protein